MLAQKEQDHQMEKGGVDPRQAVHQLAEDDEDEQASGGLNHLVHETLEGSVDEERKSPLWSTGRGGGESETFRVYLTDPAGQGGISI